MVGALARIAWRFICILELVVFNQLLYLATWLPTPLLRRFQPFYFVGMRLWSKLFVKALGVDLRLHEKHHKPLPEHYILIANHPSAFEDVGIPALFPVLSLAKAEVRDWWFAGRITWAGGNLFVKREDRDSRHDAYQQLIDTVNSGKNIAVYPEGGCKGRRIFETFRYGAFDISLKTGVPILPVFLHYEMQDLFEWRAPQTLPYKLWQFLTAQNPRANYYVYDAIDPSPFGDKVEYMEHVHKLYLQWQARYLD
ncbi:MAG: 1-acyl-sn-glycerol-3-phosphate acyltransferase [Gammaproteobacteria bacterium]|nr:1-acyl-sn-glycerol-3-phosphate acyltransferase [Gammaproteobacteria bacterium]